MNYLKVLKSDIANGTGFRCTLFVSGCCRKCPGCFNPISHDPNVGKPFDEEIKKKIFDELSLPYIKGLSVLGGEPFSITSNHRDVIPAFLKEVKEKFPDKDIWVWTRLPFIRTVL